MPHRPTAWTEGHTRCALLVIAALAILVSVTVLVDLIEQNRARGAALRARLADPDRVRLVVQPNDAAQEVAAALP